MRNKRFGKLLSAALAAAMALSLSSAALAAGNGETHLTIIGTSDTHGNIWGYSYEDMKESTGDGLARVSTYVNQVRSENPNTILVDAGDTIQGTIMTDDLYSKDTASHPVAAALNYMDYDAWTLGNHEFDFGLDNLARLVRRAHFPVVCANYHFEDTPLDGLIKPYVILHRGGLKIGVFGLSPRPQGLIFSEYYRGVRYEDPVVAANRVAALLKRKKHCDLVICLSHLGWKGAESDETLIASTRHIDLVLGGHSHSYFEHPLTYPNLDGLPVPVQQMGKYGRFLGWIEVDYSRESSRSE